MTKIPVKIINVLNNTLADNADNADNKLSILIKSGVIPPNKGRIIRAVTFEQERQEILKNSVKVLW